MSTVGGGGAGTRRPDSGRGAGEDWLGSADDLWEQWRQLTAHALREQAALARRSAVVARRLANGDTVVSASSGRSYVDLAARESARYWKGALTLGLTYGGNLVALAQGSARRVLDEAAVRQMSSNGPMAHGGHSGSHGHHGHVAEDTQDSPGAGPAQTADTEVDLGPRRIPLELSGPLGSEVTARVSVVNRQKRARRLGFDVRPMASGSAEAFVPDLRFEPPTVLLKPGEEAEVLMQLELDGSVFVAGATYRGDVLVRGGDDITLAVVVRAT